LRIFTLSPAQMDRAASPVNAFGIHVSVFLVLDVIRPNVLALVTLQRLVVRRTTYPTHLLVVQFGLPDTVTVVPELFCAAVPVK
jgi:hypothetical protein